MTSFRNNFYAALLGLSMVNMAPTLVSAQQAAGGHFTLPHDVVWENAAVPAGEYRFVVESDRVEVVRLAKVGGSPACFLFMVRSTDDSKPTDTSRILLDKTPSGSYVSAMQLPEYGMTLRFAVPVLHPQKDMAKATPAPAAPAQ